MRSFRNIVLAFLAGAFLSAPVLAGPAQAPYYTVKDQNNLIPALDYSGSMLTPVNGSTVSAPLVDPLGIGDLDGDGFNTSNGSGGLGLDLFNMLENYGIPPYSGGHGTPNHLTRDIDRDGLPGKNQMHTDGTLFHYGCAIDANCNNEETGFNRRTDVAFEVIRQVLDPNRDGAINSQDDQLLRVRIGLAAFHTAEWSNARLSNQFRAGDRAALQQRDRTPISVRALPPTVWVPGGSLGKDKCYGNQPGQPPDHESKLRFLKRVGDVGDASESATHKVYDKLNSLTALYKQNADGTLAGSWTPITHTLNWLRAEIWPSELDTNPASPTYDAKAACRKNYQILVTDGEDTCIPPSLAPGHSYGAELNAPIFAAALAYNSSSAWAGSILPFDIFGLFPRPPSVVPSPTPLPNPQGDLLGNDWDGNESNTAAGGFYVSTFVVGVGTVQTLGFSIATLHLTALAGGTDANLDGDNDPTTFCAPIGDGLGGWVGYYFDTKAAPPFDAQEAPGGTTCSLCSTVGLAASNCLGTAFFGENIQELSASLTNILAQVQAGEYVPYQPQLTFSATQQTGLYIASEEVGSFPIKKGHLRLVELDENFHPIDQVSTGSIFKFDSPVNRIDCQLNSDAAAAVGDPCYEAQSVLTLGHETTHCSDDAYGTAGRNYGHECRRFLAIPASGVPAGADSLNLVSAEVSSSEMTLARLDLSNPLMPAPVKDANGDGTIDATDVQRILDYARDDHEAPLGGGLPQTTGLQLRAKNHTLLGLTANKAVTTGPYNQFELLLLPGALGASYLTAMVHHSTDPALYITGNGDGGVHAILQESAPPQNVDGLNLSAYLQGDEAWTVFPTEAALKDLPYLRFNDRAGMSGQCRVAIMPVRVPGDLVANINDTHWRRLLTCAMDRDLFVLDITNPLLPKTFGSVTLAAPITMTPLMVMVKPASATDVPYPAIFVGTDRINGSTGEQVYMYRADNLAAGPAWSSALLTTLGQPPEINDLMGFSVGLALDTNAQSDLYADEFFFLTSNSFKRGGVVLRLKTTNIGDTSNWSTEVAFINRDHPDLGGNGDGHYDAAPGLTGEDNPTAPALDQGATRLAAFYDNQIPPHLNLLVTFAQSILNAPAANITDHIRWFEDHGSGALTEKGTGGPGSLLDPAPTWDPTGFPLTLQAGSSKFISDVVVAAGIAFFEWYDSTPVSPPCGQGTTYIAALNMFGGGTPFDLDPNSAGINAIVIPDAVASPPLISVVDGSLFYAYQDAAGSLQLQGVKLNIPALDQGQIGSQYGQQ